MAAAELIGKALLSASLELLFDGMASKQVVDFVRGNKLLDDGLLKLKMMLLLSVNNGVLNEAEKKQISDPSVRKWLDELKHSIYNAEDLVYQIYTVSLRCEIEAACRSKSFKLQVLNFFSSRFSVNNVEIEKIEHEMVDILDSLEYTVRKKGLLGLELEGGVIENKSSPRPLEGEDYPQKLSDEESWRLFTKIAFNNHIEQSAGYPALEVIGRRIVERCKGVPVAVKLVAGVLCSERNPEKWDEILKDEIWELVDHEKETDIPPALWLSYYYLPPHLKRCFAYCSIFPKGYEFEKQDLIWLWMAENLLQPQKNKIPEEVGEEYFNYLTSKLFFHCGKIDNYFTMHDLVNDLASFVSGEFSMRLDDSDTKLVTSNVRHLSCLIQNHYINELEAPSNEKMLLRTLLPKKWSIEQTIDLELLQRMQCLRVLRTGRISIAKLPSSIGNLKLLRYLDLSMSEFEVLPDTIGNLYNLQTLLLGSCMRLYWLPDSISNLKHLRHLDLSWNILLLYLPDAVCDLHNLHTLSLNNCRALCRLPTDMAKLINLRHLDIIRTNIREMPPQMSYLRYLQTLSSR